MIGLLSASAPEVAPQLVGWQLRSTIGGARVAVEIEEVEAYTADDPASHSATGRSLRNASMFGPAGTAYVYLSYGIHWCLNVVTGPTGDGQAVLLRGARVVEGRRTVVERRGRADHLTDGPGKLCQALGITGHQDGIDLTASSELRLIRQPSRPVVATPRIGISKATDRPWRWLVDRSVTSGPA